MRRMGHPGIVLQLRRKLICELRPITRLTADKSAHRRRLMLLEGILREIKQELGGEVIREWKHRLALWVLVLHGNRLSHLLHWQVGDRPCFSDPVAFCDRWRILHRTYVDVTNASHGSNGSVAGYSRPAISEPAVVMEAADIIWHDAISMPQDARRRSARSSHRLRGIRANRLRTRSRD
jgi:hypothetical protein